MVELGLCQFLPVKKVFYCDENYSLADIICFIRFLPVRRKFFLCKKSIDFVFFVLFWTSTKCRAKDLPFCVLVHDSWFTPNPQFCMSLYWLAVPVPATSQIQTSFYLFCKAGRECCISQRCVLSMRTPAVWIASHWSPGGGQTDWAALFCKLGWLAGWLASWVLHPQCLHSLASNALGTLYHSKRCIYKASRMKIKARFIQVI